MNVGWNGTATTFVCSRSALPAAALNRRLVAQKLRACSRALLRLTAAAPASTSATDVDGGETVRTGDGSDGTSKEAAGQTVRCACDVAAAAGRPRPIDISRLPASPTTIIASQAVSSFVRIARCLCSKSKVK